MRAMTLLLLIIAIIIFLSLKMPFIAAILFLALVVIIIYFLLSKTAVAVGKTGKSLSKGVMTDLEKAKGQSPKAVSEFGKMFEAIGAKTGENTWPKEKETYGSPDLVGRIGAGAKNLLEGIGRLFK